MKIDFTQQLKDFSGEVLKLDEKSAPLTLKDMISLSIKTTLPDDNTLTLQQKLDLDKIGEIVWSGEGELDTAQATLIKERISKVFTAPAVSGAVKRAIEG